jgi:hypothetical protein
MAPDDTKTPSRWQQRIGTAAIGHTGKLIESVVFDHLIYGAVVAYAILHYGEVYGSVVSFVMMAPISAVVCYAYLRLYDWAGVDLFGFEAVKALREGLDHEGLVTRLMQRVIQWGDVPAFLVLTTVYPGADPFMATVYLRKGASGMSRRDWTIFWLAVVISNGYWTLRWVVLVALATHLWPIIEPYLEGLY